MTTAESALRHDLAAAFRLAAIYGMTDLIFTHFTARVDEDSFLMNPYGLMFDEITASNLVKVDREGLLRESSQYLANPPAFAVHIPVHSNRPDARFVLHTHTRAGCAVAAQREGLLPLNQISMEFVGRIGYHPYGGLDFDAAEQGRLAHSLGDYPALILRNHGLLTVGETIAQAFIRMHYLNRACQIQVDALAGGAEIVLPDAELVRVAGEDLNADSEAQELAWEALLRQLQRVAPDFAN